MSNLVYHGFTERVYLDPQSGESISMEEWMRQVENRLEGLVRHYIDSYHRRGVYVEGEPSTKTDTAWQPDSPTWNGDDRHHGWEDYVATNLLDALENLVPDTGDWHGALRMWCKQHKSGNIKPNRQDAP